MSTGALRPLDIGEIIDAAIKLYTRNAKVLIGAAASVVIPLQLLSAVVLMSIYNDGNDIPAGGFSSFGKTFTPDEAHARLGASGINQGLTLLAATFVTAACVKAISDSYMGEQSDIGTTVKFGLRRLFPLLWMELIYVLLLIIGFVLLIVPGIWLYASLAVATPALLIERRGAGSALNRSRKLVKGRWWGTAGVVFVAAVINGVAGGVVVGLLTAIALASHHPSVLFAVSITTLATIVTQVLLQPFTAAVTTVLYYDLRVRHEGYDIEIFAEQLGLSQPTLSPLAPGWMPPPGPADAGKPGGPPYWPPPPGWKPGG